jgi:hypothetical protein
MSGYQFYICAGINAPDDLNMVQLLHISCQYYPVSSFAHYNLYRVMYLFNMPK